ncbi:MAG: hypothetical protein QXD03_03965 [Candidatus Anstonellales archaeon]
MPDNVKKVFSVLITAVVCVILGAFVLNILLPNTTTTLINATESMVFKATGLGFDFNNDGFNGSSNTKTFNGSINGKDDELKGGVQGFK